MSETKTKYAIYLYPSQMEEIKSLMEQANAKSQSEFVSDAIRFYIGYLQQGKNVNYLAPIITQCIREEISSTEKNISQILFKLAVEAAMVAQLEAVQLRVSEEQMSSLRRTCSNKVAENNGIRKCRPSRRISCRHFSPKRKRQVSTKCTTLNWQPACAGANCWG